MEYEIAFSAQLSPMLKCHILCRTWDSFISSVLCRTLLSSTNAYHLLQLKHRSILPPLHCCLDSSLQNKPTYRTLPPHLAAWLPPSWSRLAAIKMIKRWVTWFMIHSVAEKNSPWDRATTSAPWKPALYKLAQHRGSRCFTNWPIIAEESRRSTNWPWIHLSSKLSVLGRRPVWGSGEPFSYRGGWNLGSIVEIGRWKSWELGLVQRSSDPLRRVKRTG